MPSKPGVRLTYSPAVTLVPTNECFNRCTYCNFRRDSNDATWLSLQDAQLQLEKLQGTGVCEILILSGEVHPRSSRRQHWFEHIYQLCELVIAAGFLPHSNVGPLSYREMASLGQVNVSMGLMLEQHSVLDAHIDAPSKEPELRVQQLRWAGELRIPFTTGLLFGIGESREDWKAGLEAIASIHRQWGHIQEVILQPYQPGSQEPQPRHALLDQDLIEAVKMARSILPEAIAIQIPPNLIAAPETLRDCIAMGATDLGGLVPHDFVNPDYAHQPFAALSSQLKTWGHELQPRLPVYESFYGQLTEPLRQSLRPWLQDEKPLGYANLGNSLEGGPNLQEMKY